MSLLDKPRSFTTEERAYQDALVRQDRSILNEALAPHRGMTPEERRADMTCFYRDVFGGSASSYHAGLPGDWSALSNNEDS